MERICHDEYPGVGHLWCHRLADRMEEMAELVAVLVDETMTVAAGGTIYDDKGKVSKSTRAGCRRCLSSTCPRAARSSRSRSAGSGSPSRSPEEHHDDDDDDHAEEAAEPVAAPASHRRGHGH